MLKIHKNLVHSQIELENSVKLEEKIQEFGHEKLSKFESNEIVKRVKNKTKVESTLNIKKKTTVKLSNKSFITEEKSFGNEKTNGKVPQQSKIHAKKPHLNISNLPSQEFLNTQSHEMSHKDLSCTDNDENTSNANILFWLCLVLKFTKVQRLELSGIQAICLIRNLQ